MRVTVGRDRTLIVNPESETDLAALCFLFGRNLADGDVQIRADMVFAASDGLGRLQIRPMADPVREEVRPNRVSEAMQVQTIPGDRTVREEAPGNGAHEKRTCVRDGTDRTVAIMRENPEKRWSLADVQRSVPAPTENALRQRMWKLTKAGIIRRVPNRHGVVGLMYELVPDEGEAIPERIPTQGVGVCSQDEDEYEVRDVPILAIGNGCQDLEDGTVLDLCVGAIRSQAPHWMTLAGIQEVIHGVFDADVRASAVDRALREQRHARTYQVPGLEARQQDGRWEYRLARAVVPEVPESA